MHLHSSQLFLNLRLCNWTSIQMLVISELFTFLSLLNDIFLILHFLVQVPTSLNITQPLKHLKQLNLILFSPLDFVKDLEFDLLWILNILQISPLLQKLSIMVSEHSQCTPFIIIIFCGYRSDFEQELFKLSYTFDLENHAIKIVTFKHPNIQIHIEFITLVCPLSFQI